jgi:seryl-tRNA synthetase
MLLINFLRENTEKVIKLLHKKNFDAKEIVDDVLQIDLQRRNTQQELDNILFELNSLARQIGDLFKQGNKDEANRLKEKTVQLKEDSKKLDEKLREIEKSLQDKLLLLPNLPHESVPVGKTPEENIVSRTHGEIPELHKDAMPHWDLAKKYNLIDLELGVKITGAGFPVYKGKGARLQRALINFFLDNAVKEGYLEVQPPILVNEDTAFATGQLPDKEGQMYFAEKDNFYLIPTAEVPLTNMFRDEILEDKNLPVKVCGYTPCFRREAGSYGKDVRGLNRLHQFDKVEIVQIERPGNSYNTLEKMVSYVETLLQKLELPYRVLLLCGGDMSFASAKTYDLEVFSAAQNRWLEVSSVSNFETFQSNRLKLRFRDENRKTRLLHTLNGSALAFPRIVAALLENNQTPEGIKIPKALQEYTGFDLIS